MEIRKITPDDWQAYRNLRLAALQSIDAQAFGGSYEKESIRSEDEWRGRFDGSRERIFYGCFLNEELISVAGVYLNVDEDKFKNEWIIVGVYTNPKFRGQGISFRTIETVLEELRDKGVKKVILMVNTKQKSAMRVYEKLGFKIVELIKDEVMGDGQIHDEYLMELYL